MTKQKPASGRLESVDVSVRRLTAAGRGAVASILFRAAAADAVRVLDEHFLSHVRHTAGNAPVDRILFGSWRGEDVVVVRTSQDTWEIHCHGGEAAVSRIVADLTAGGARSAPASDGPGGDRPQPRLEAELFHELLKARTRQTASLVLAQWQGNLRQFLEQLATADSVDDLQRGIRSLQQWRGLCEHLTEPWVVAVIGQPNAGKSSLLNAVVGYERSIVCETAGTTRDRVEVDIHLGGWPFRLVDTAGIRGSTEDEIEADGIALARQVVASCDACLLVVDGTIGFHEPDRHMTEIVPADTPLAVLMNKSDLNEKPSEIPEILRKDSTALFVTSATTGAGIPEILSWIQELLVPAQPHVEAPLPACPLVREVCDDVTELITRGGAVGTSCERIRQLLDM